MAVTHLKSVTFRLDHILEYVKNPEKTSKDKLTDDELKKLDGVIQYAADEDKTELALYVDGINCNPATACEQFVTVKEQFNKVNGVQAYHGWMSFKGKELTPDQAHKICMEFANEVWGKRFQVLVGTHLNTDNFHTHFVINSVSFVDGKKLHGDEKAWFKFRLVADEICKKYGLEVEANPQKGKSLSYDAYKKQKAGMPTRYDVARQLIDTAITQSYSYADFQYISKKYGFKITAPENRKYPIVQLDGWEKPIRLYRLGDDYTIERIHERIKENTQVVSFKDFQKATYRPRQYLLLTREHKIRKVGGLYGLYLHYCYKLGTLPKYQKQNSARLHYLLRDDLARVDQYTEQVRLLGRENISTSEELFLYKSKVEEEIKTLTADRTHLRNEIRKVNIDDDKLNTAKERISQISKRLKTLRKEVKVCNGIAERSGIVQERLATVLADEEKIKRKENRNYVQQR